MITSFAWLIWLGLIIVFVIIEALTVELTFLMLAIGSLGGLIAGLFPVPFVGQIIIFAGVAILLLLFLRPPLLRRLRRHSDPARSNIDALIGMSGTVILPVSEGDGQVKLIQGDVWSARLAENPHSDTNDNVLPIGAHITVVKITGATALVRPENTETENSSSQRGDS